MNRRSARNRNRNGSPPPPPVPRARPVVMDQKQATHLLNLGARVMRDQVETVGLVNAGVMFRRVGVPMQQGVIHATLGAGYAAQLIADVIDRHAPPPSDPDVDMKAHVEAMPAWAREILVALGIVQVEVPEGEAAEQPPKEESLEARAKRSDLVIASS